MFDFAVFELIVLVLDGCGVGLLLCYLIPVNPATLPRTVAWLQANKDPDPDSWMPVTFYRFGVSLLAVIIIAWTQYGVMKDFLVPPTWADTLSPLARVVVFLGVEVLLFVWTVYVYWEFRRAANKAR